MSRTIKFRPAAAAFRLIKRGARWSVRVRVAKGVYKQRASGSVHRAAAKEFAIHWIKEEFPGVCRLLGITPTPIPSAPADAPVATTDPLI